ncbi:unnamed protein product [Acanthoscelides obtectus]|uniref:Uncharacterized protein n=1 Tax=Acanthoscelides obtectus TaxID=200917 RepID=A0A9P0LQR7_ACAOB|nr:unnamed protein product [Acanthoscelides obtectus]CAK1670913.1 hypothetical protein AOBTE_LOCUS27913 [Acanthoscelides obtectus]
MLNTEQDEEVEENIDVVEKTTEQLPSSTITAASPQPRSIPLRLCQFHRRGRLVCWPHRKKEQILLAKYH